MRETTCRSSMIDVSRSQQETNVAKAHQTRDLLRPGQLPHITRMKGV